MKIRHLWDSSYVITCSAGAFCLPVHMQRETERLFRGMDPLLCFMGNASDGLERGVFYG